MLSTLKWALGITAFFWAFGGFKTPAIVLAMYFLGTIAIIWLAMVFAIIAREIFHEIRKRRVIHAKEPRARARQLSAQEIEHHLAKWYS